MRAEKITAPFLIEGAVNAEVFTAYLEKVLCPGLRAGDLVILDNLSTHKVAGVAAALANFQPAHCQGFFRHAQ